MKKVGLVMMVCSMGAITQAQPIDDFSGDLSAYTATRILNAGPHTPVNTWAWEISGGALQINTTAWVGIEQFALTRTDYGLLPGYELKADFTAAYTGTQDIGLYVGAGTPVQDVRANYVNIYMRNNGQLFSRGIDGATGTTEFGLSGGGYPLTTALFVARTGTDMFDLGWYDSTGRHVLTTRTIANGNAAGIGSAIGFYADVRGAGIVGSMDNLQIAIIPEPSSIALLGLEGLGLALLRRNK